MWDDDDIEIISLYFDIAAIAKQYAIGTGFAPTEALRAFLARSWLIKGVIDDGIKNQVRFELMKHLEVGRPLIETIGNLRRIFEPYVGDPEKIQESGPPDLMQAYRLENIVRTESSWSLNQGRLAIADAADDYVVGFEYSAILDERNSVVCRYAGGGETEEGESLDEPLRMRADDQRAKQLTPPNHFNCRSIYIYLTKDDLPIEFSTDAEIDRAVRLIQKNFK